MLALLARDLSAETLPVTLSLLSRRRLVGSNTDSNTFDAWAARLMSLLSGPANDLRLVAMRLLRESIKQCAQDEFARHREVWVNALLHLLQPNNNAADASGQASIRLAAAEALVQMATVASLWPPERREMSSTISRLASNLVSMINEPVTQRGAIAALSRLSAAAPHCLRAHRENLEELLAGIVLEAPAAAARGAAILLSQLPGCLPPAGVEDAWLAIVKRVAGTLQEVLLSILGSVTNRAALRYALPTYTLPQDALPPMPTGAGAPSATSHGRRAALVRCMRRCALAIHCCLCPGGSIDGDMPAAAAAAAASSTGSAADAPSGQILPLPVDMLLQLALHVLSVDGALPQRSPADGALPHAELLVILPECHVAALQIAQSTTQAARRHALHHTSALVGVLRRSWQLSGTSGPTHMRCAVLRAASLRFASTLLDVHGPCVVSLLGEPLAKACAHDMSLALPSAARKVADDEAAAAAAAAASARGGQASKRQRTSAPAAATGDASWAATPSPHGLAVQCGAASAAKALFAAGVELLPIAHVDSLQGTLLALCAPNAATPPKLYELALAALHASITSGRTPHPHLLPRALASMQHAATVHADPAVRAAALMALHALDSYLHPCGALAWGASAPEAGAEASAAPVTATGGLHMGGGGELNAATHLLSGTRTTTFLPTGSGSGGGDSSSTTPAVAPLASSMPAPAGFQASAAPPQPTPQKGQLPVTLPPPPQLPPVPPSMTSATLPSAPPPPATTVTPAASSLSAAPVGPAPAAAAAAAVAAPQPTQQTASVPLRPTTIAPLPKPAMPPQHKVEAHVAAADESADSDGDVEIVDVGPDEADA